MVAIVTNYFISTTNLKVTAMAHTTAIRLFSIKIRTILILLTLIKAFQWRITPIHHLIATPRSALIVIIAVVINNLHSSKAEYGFLTLLMTTTITHLTIVVCLTCFLRQLCFYIFSILTLIGHVYKLMELEVVLS